VFRGLRIAKIDQQSIAHVSRDIAAEALCNVRAASEEAGDDFPEVLGVVSLGESRGPHKVAKHDGELTPLSYANFCVRCCHAPKSSIGRGRAHCEPSLVSTVLVTALSTSTYDTSETYVVGRAAAQRLSLAQVGLPHLNGK
jgi:hypothetical protein